MAKDSHNPMILKLVLQGLMTDWQVAMQDLTQPCNRAVNPALLLAALDHGSQGVNLNGTQVLGPRPQKPRPSILKLATADNSELNCHW